MSRDRTEYLRLDWAALVGIDHCDPAITGGVARHAFVSGHGGGATNDEALDSLAVRLRQLARLIERRPRSAPDVATLDREAKLHQTVLGALAEMVGQDVPGPDEQEHYRAARAWIDAAADALRLHQLGHHDRELLEFVQGEREQALRELRLAREALASFDLAITIAREGACQVLDKEGVAIIATPELGRLGRAAGYRSDEKYGDLAPADDEARAKLSWAVMHALLTVVSVTHDREALGDVLVFRASMPTLAPLFRPGEDGITLKEAVERALGHVEAGR